MITTKFKIVLFVFVLLTTAQSFSGTSFDALETDTSNALFFGFFDLRDRETFIQITNVDLNPTGHNVHIQFFDVSNDCNENNFFDFYTPNDTHIYNVIDIQTNDGNDSGVILPDGAYGIFVAFGAQQPDQVLIGNLRILDNNGYEYRTNLQGTDPDQSNAPLEEFATFNFNTKGGVTPSEILLPGNNRGPPLLCGMALLMPYSISATLAAQLPLLQLLPVSLAASSSNAS